MEVVRYVCVYSRTQCEYSDSACMIRVIVFCDRKYKTCAEFVLTWSGTITYIAFVPISVSGVCSCTGAGPIIAKEP